MVRCTFGGHIQSNQSWSSSLWLNVASGSTVIGQADLNALAAVVGPILDTLAGAVATTAWATGTQYDMNHFQYYLSGQAKPSRTAVRTPSIVAGTGSVLLPSFCAIVASLRTAVPGRGGRGRSYLPLTNGTPMSGGANQISTAATTNLCTAYKTALQSLNSMTLAAPWTAHVAAVRSSSMNDGLPITSVIVNSLPDHQSRREDKLLPLYTSAQTV
jgi:hypothetical protein